MAFLSDPAPSIQTFPGADIVAEIGRLLSSTSEIGDPGPLGGAGVDVAAGGDVGIAVGAGVFVTVRSAVWVGDGPDCAGSVVGETGLVPGVEVVKLSVTVSTGFAASCGTGVKVAAIAPVAGVAVALKAIVVAFGAGAAGLAAVAVTDGVSEGAAS